MVEKKLVNYIEEGVALGHSLDSLKKSLLKAGWDEDLIDEARTHYVMRNRNKISSPKFNPASPIFFGNKPRFILIVAFLHFFIALWWVANFIIMGLMFDPLFSAYNENMTFILNLLIGLIVSTLPVFIGIGILRRNKKWKIVAIILALIFSLTGILSVIQLNILGILYWLVCLFILYVLFFDRSSRHFFG